jgi:hypothetical protein
MYQYISLIYYIKILSFFINTKWVNNIFNLIDIHIIHIYASLVDNNQILSGINTNNLGISILLNELLKIISYLTNYDLSLIKVYLINSFNNSIISLATKNIVFGYNFNTYLLIIFYISNFINLINVSKNINKYSLPFTVMFLSLIPIFNDLNLLNLLNL